MTYPLSSVETNSLRVSIAFWPPILPKPKTEPERTKLRSSFDALTNTSIVSGLAILPKAQTAPPRALQFSSSTNLSKVSIASSP
nr:hypothetical protein [Methanosphaera stadtmanae]